MQIIKYTLVILLCALSSQLLWAQQGEMQTDFGFTRGRNVYLWPVIYKTKNDSVKQLHVAASLFMYKRQFETPRLHLHTLPLFWYDSSAKQRDFRMLSLYYPSLFRQTFMFGNQVRSTALFELCPQVNLLEFAQSPDGTFCKRNLFFLFSYQNNRLEQRSHTVVAPLYWNFRNMQHLTRVFVPFFSYHRGDSATSSTWIFPFFVFNNRPMNASRQLVLFPLYFGKKSPALTYDVYFPLIWSFRNPAENTVVVAPFYAQHRDTVAGATQFRAFTPFYWHLWGGNEHANIVFPFYWNQYNRNADGSRSRNYATTLLLPFYYAERNDTGKIDHLWAFPTLFYKKKWNGSSRLTVFPLYFNKRDKGYDHDVLFPLVWRYKRPDKLSFVCMPLFAYSYDTVLKKKYWAATPFLWHSKSKYRQLNLLFPVVWHYKKYGYYDSSLQSSTFAVLPLFRYKFEQTDEHSLWILPNIFYKQDSYDSLRRLTLFPLWFHKRTNESAREVVFPLLWYYRRPEKTAFVLMPFFGFGRDTIEKKRFFAVTPLYWNIKNPKRNFSFVAPLYWNYTRNRWRDTTHTKLFIPLYFSRQEIDEYYSNEKTIDNKQVFLPVFWNFVRKRMKGDTLLYEKKFKGIEPLFGWGHSYNLRDSSYRLKTFHLTPLFWSYKTAYDHRMWFIPLWWYKHDYSESYFKHYNVVFPLYWHYVKQRYNYYDTIKQADTLRTTVFFPLYWHYVKDHKVSTTLFSVFWFEKRFEYDDNARRYKKSSNSVSALLFPVFWYTHSPSENATTIFPVYWYKQQRQWNSSLKQYDSIQLQSRVVFPFYFNVRKGFEQYKAVVPLYLSYQNTRTHYCLRSCTPFYYHASSPDSSFTLLVPFYYRKRMANYRSTSVYPLYSHGKYTADTAQHHRGDAYTMLTPLFWHWRAASKRATLFVPLFYTAFDTAHHAQQTWLTPTLLYMQHSDTLHQISFPWPLVCYKHSPQTRHFRIVPLVWYNKTPQRMFCGVMPFVYARKCKGVQHINVLWQLYHFRKDSISRRHQVLGIVYSKYSDVAGNRAQAILYRMFVNSSINGTQTNCLFPLYAHTTDTAGNYSHSYAAAFYSNFARQIPGTSEFYKEVKLFWFIRLRSNYQYLRAKGIEVNRRGAK